MQVEDGSARSHIERHATLRTVTYVLSGAAAPVTRRDALVVTRRAARAGRTRCTSVLVEVRALTDGAAGTREQRPRDTEEHQDQDCGECAAAPCQCDCDNSHAGEARTLRRRPV